MEDKKNKKFQSVFDKLSKEVPDKKDRLELLLRTKEGDEIDRSFNDQMNSLNVKIQQRNLLFRKKIEDALARIEDGTFGICEECDGEISIGRLKARPTATMCIKCKENEEREESSIVYHKKSQTLGKEIKNSNLVSMEIFKEDKNSKTVEVANLALVN